MRPGIAPGPRGLPLLGNLAAFRRDVLGLLTDSRARFGDVVRFRLGPLVIHLVAHPDGIRRVLQEHMENFDKETRSSSKIRGMTGLGLLTGSGELWRRHRRLIQPGFRPAAVDGYVARMAEATASMLARWEAQRGRPLDVASEMMRLTYTIVGRTLFSADVSEGAPEVEEAMKVMLAHTYRRLERVIDPPEWVPTPGNLRFREALEHVDRVVYRIVAERRAMKPEDAPDDLLSRLLAERDEADEGLDDQELRNEVITLLLAGHETTANALAWTLHLLARHSEVQEKLRAEVESVLGGLPPTAEDLSRLTYAETVLRESMRLYPPIWALERRVIEDDEIAGHRIPAGSTVVVSPWVTHRHPDFWEDPERFDPDRFTGERSEGRPPLAYIPFGAGPHFCVGGHFAMVEALVITALVVRSWRLLPEAAPEVVPEAGITLRPRSGVWVRLSTS